MKLKTSLLENKVMRLNPTLIATKLNEDLIELKEGNQTVTIDREELLKLAKWVNQ